MGLRQKSNRISGRMRVLYLVVPAVIIIVLILLGTTISLDIADNAAERMSRQYSVEAASNFQVFMNPHMRLMNQLAYSTAVGRWLADEHDLEAKEAAFRDMMIHAATMPDAYLMFTTYETWRGYNFGTDLAFDEFVSWGQLSGGAASQWFFDTINAQKPFILNIQRTRPDEYGNWDLYIWSNHRIYYEGRVVGVFTLGSPFASVFDATFGGFEAEGKRGYVIDADGLVRLDSAGILETEIDGIPVRPQVPEASNNPGLLESINNHVQMLRGGMYQLGTPIDYAIRIDSGEYRYASISPIIETDWSIIVLSGYDFRLVQLSYIPLFVVAMVLLFAAVAYGAVTVNRTVISPLKKLVQSTVDLAKDSEASVYGTERTDEIGDISKAISDMLQRINELRKAELQYESERAAEQASKMFLDAAPISVNWVDENFTPIDCNEYTFELFGFVNKKEYWANLSKLHPEFQPCGIKSSEKLMEYLQATKEKGYVRFEWLHNNINGEPIETEIVMAKLDIAGKVVIATYTIDLRQIKDAMRRENELKMKLHEQEMNERTAHMFNSAPLMIDYWNRDFKVIDCNQYAIDFFGFTSKDDYIKEEPRTLLATKADGASAHESRNRKLAEVFEKGYGKFTFAEKKLSGETVVLEVEGVRIKSDDEYVVVTYAKDITQDRENEYKLRKLQEQRFEAMRESNLAKDRFLARMSHELRTPLTAVMGISELQLREKGLPPKIEESFSDIYESGKTLLHIVNDILDFSKIEAGKMTLMLDKYDVASLVSDAVQVHSIYSENQKVSFRIHVDEHLPAALFGDALRIRQIITNLLTNAFKFTDLGYVEFTVYCEKESKKRTTLVVIIEDTGAGMTAEQVDEIRGEYVRLYDRDKQFVSGTGLGIPIVYSLVELMGAEFDLQSKQGKGTRAVVRIPQEISSAEVLGSELAKQLQSTDLRKRSAIKDLEFAPEQFKHGKVLVVDDVEINLHVAKSMLNSFGLTAEICSGGKEVIDKIKQGEKYDVIFMDHMMPELDGVETTKILRDMGYGEPIVALTANAIKGQADMYMENGFSGVITKPIDIKLLNSCLIRFIKNKDVS